MAMNGTTILVQVDHVGLTEDCRSMWLRGPLWVLVV
jgi:hypothetical protein